ncbi:MAG: hypothetical protein M1840_006109 [Geoglossum simile]|nr:MAG: hypothetical protein M1840_006109 [Geoglossum simile]
MSSDETPAFTYKLVTPGNILAVPRKVLMQESLDTERKPSNTVSVSIKYSNWEAASASMGFTTTVDDEGKDIETASNQMVLFGAIGSNTAPGTLSQKDRSLVFGGMRR